MSRTLQGLLIIQGAYYALSGLWPLISYRTFARVTGSKTDVWLVRTVGVLAMVIGAALLTAALQQTGVAAVWTLAMGSATAFAVIDVVYVAARRIAPVYLLDAGVEIILAVLLALALLDAGAAG